MNFINRVKFILDKGHSRSIRAKKNVILSISIKGMGVFIGFTYFPISLDYLGAAKFGIYLTLISMVDWFLDLDIGIANGLRNKFGESVAQGEDKRALHFVSTAYFLIGGLVAILVVLLTLGNFLIPWLNWLNIDPILFKEVRMLMVIIIIGFGIRFVSANIYEIFYAMQKMAYVEFFSLVTKICFLVFIIIIAHFTEESLLIFGSAKSLTFAFVPLIVSIYFFGKKFKKYKPSLKYVRFDYIKDLFSLGMKFFLIKISIIIIHQTNNFLIARYISLEGVSQYEAAYKYLSVFLMLFVILTNQLWPSNIEAYAQGDLKWMKKTMKAVIKIWIGSIFTAALMVFISPFVYKYWLLENLQIPIMISVFVAVSICLTTWVNMFNMVLNGTGKIILQMYAWIFAACINIPASIYLAKQLDLGVVGIVLGTVVSLMPLAILSPIQVKKILSHKESGVWAM